MWSRHSNNAGDGWGGGDDAGVTARARARRRAKGGEGVRGSERESLAAAKAGREPCIEASARTQSPNLLLLRIFRILGMGRLHTAAMATGGGGLHCSSCCACACATPALEPPPPPPSAYNNYYVYCHGLAWSGLARRNPGFTFRTLTHAQSRQQKRFGETRAGKTTRRSIPR
jgi:hypothetical protein